MFADSLYDSAGTRWSHRGWTTLASFAVQALAIGCLLILPLLHMQSLPQMQWTRNDLTAPSPAPPAPPPRELATGTFANNRVGQIVVAPAQIPSSGENLHETNATPAAPDISLCYANCAGTGDRTATPGVFGSVGESINATALPPPPAVAHPPRVSRMMEGNLIQRVQPVYPLLARQARIQGTVVLRAVISREGRIEKLQVASGHPLLVQAAMDAVRQWRYRPYVLNNEPVEVDTQVTVNFVLSGGS
jgi:periplasmic protein TonB